MGNFCIVDALRISWERRKVDRSELHCRYYKCLRTCRLTFLRNLSLNSFILMFEMQILVALRNNSSVAGGYVNFQRKRE